jgi:hypothetical protein
MVWHSPIPKPKQREQGGKNDDQIVPFADSGPFTNEELVSEALAPFRAKAIYYGFLRDIRRDTPAKMGVH